MITYWRGMVWGLQEHWEETPPPRAALSFTSFFLLFSLLSFSFPTRIIWISSTSLVTLGTSTSSPARNEPLPCKRRSIRWGPMSAFLRVFVGSSCPFTSSPFLVGDTCTWRWRMGNGSKSGTSVFAEEVRKKMRYAREYFTWASPVTWCVRWRTKKSSLQEHIWTKILWILVKLSDRVQHVYPGDFFFFNHHFYFPVQLV